jgi:hypothetical protein
MNLTVRPRNQFLVLVSMIMASSALGLAACGAPAEDIDVAATVAVMLTDVPPTTAPASTAAAPTATSPAPLSFEPTQYRNAAAGFEFDYPSQWTVGPDQQYSRGGVTPLTSWTRQADVLPDATPPGETRLDATVQLWDPKGDLEAFIGQRQAAWDSSGIAVISEERWALEDGRAAAAFVVQGSDGAEAYFFLTTLGDNYLVLSGEGDLALLGEIAHTVRPIPLEY